MATYGSIQSRLLKSPLAVPGPITDTSTAELTETDAVQSIGGTLSATDVDGSNAFVAQTDVAGDHGYGKFSIDAAGVWTYTLNDAHNEFMARRGLHRRHHGGDG